MFPYKSLKEHASYGNNDSNEQAFSKFKQIIIIHIATSRKLCLWKVLLTSSQIKLYL